MFAFRQQKLQQEFLHEASPQLHLLATYHSSSDADEILLLLQKTIVGLFNSLTMTDTGECVLIAMIKFLDLYEGY